MAAPDGIHVPARLLWRFEPYPAEDWRRLENNAKAFIGKTRFLEHPNAVDATSDLVRGWLNGLGITPGAHWEEVVLAEGLAPRYVNVSYSARCVDAFWRLPDGSFEGVELKVTGKDGVCGLTIAEELLLRAGHTRILSVNPVRGLVGEMDAEALLSLPRRLDGVPIHGSGHVVWDRVPANGGARLHVGARR